MVMNPINDQLLLLCHFVLLTSHLTAVENEQSPELVRSINSMQCYGNGAPVVKLRSIVCKRLHPIVATKSASSLLETAQSKGWFARRDASRYATPSVSPPGSFVWLGRLPGFQ